MTMLQPFPWPRACARLIALSLALLLSAGVCVAQKKNKNNKASDNDSSANAAPATPLVQGPDFQNVDNAIGEMLAGFQLGNTDLMHRYYADNATFVSGVYEPPVVGWQNYLPLYQKQRAAFQSIQLIRRNTFVFTHGDTAWASYQWEFNAMYSNQPYSARGQTTLIFNKVGSNWLIVHNHTSQICPESAPAVSPQPAAKP
jgi:ketosteroid isomerase-like protein